MWDKLKFEIEFFKNKCKFENLKQLYLKSLIDEPKVSIYSVFSQKHKPIDFDLDTEAH